MTPQALSALKEQREQLWSTIDAVLEENAKLRTELDRLRSAPVAMEVPEKSKNSLSFWKHADGRWFCWDGYANIEMTPSRLLKDGHVQVPETDVAMIRRCLDECAWDDILQPIVDWTDRMIDALRSQRAAEGGAK